MVQSRNDTQDAPATPLENALEEIFILTQEFLNFKLQQVSKGGKRLKGVVEAEQGASPMRCKIRLSVHTVKIVF